MGTRILNRRNDAVVASASQSEIGSGDTPKAGLTWTLVELRPFFLAKGDWFVFVDDQQLIQIASEDVATYGKPHVVAIQIKQPVIFHWKVSDRSGATNGIGSDITIEETGTIA